MKRDKFVRWLLVCKERFTQTEVTSSSVMVAYYLLLSLFPLTLAIGNILPYLNISAERVLPYINIVLPDAVEDVLNPLITSLLTNSSGGLLSLGAIGLLWSAGRGISYLQRGMNKAYGVTKHSVFLIKRLFSMLIVLLIILMLVVFVLIYGLGQNLMLQLGEMFEWASVLNGYLRDLKWPVMFVFLVLMLLLAYRVVPDVKLRLKDAWPGAVFATAGLMLLTQLFTIYMRFTANSFSSYGALGAFFILMFWLNFSCMILLLGAILNATLYEIKYGQAEAQVSRVDAWVEKQLNRVTQKLFGGFLPGGEDTKAGEPVAQVDEEGEPVCSPEGAQGEGDLPEKAPRAGAEPDTDGKMSPQSAGGKKKN